MQRIKIHFKNGDILVINGNFKSLYDFLKSIENDLSGNKPFYIWIRDEQKIQAMFNVYEVIFMEVM